MTKLNQATIENFFEYLIDNVDGAHWQPCDESQHFYIDDEYIGGWAGDERRFFLINGAVGLATLLRSYKNDQ